MDTAGAKQHLSRIGIIDTLIQGKEAEIKRMKSTVASIRSSWSGSDRVQTSKNPHRISEGIEGYIDAEKDLRKEISELREERKSIIKDIESLEDVLMIRVLHSLYVLQKTYRETAYECKISESWTGAKHKQGLEKIQSFLDARKTANN